jgi:tetratricopeptide (TPR) repeat protein
MRISMVAFAALSALVTGPAQAADGYGHVEFANSGAPAAQADFLEGLAQLHDFEYSAAVRSFQRAEAADPAFAMAYWGEAMTFNHPIWMQQDVKAARSALAKLGPTQAERRAKAKTDREKSYLDAVEILYGDGTKADRDMRYEAAMAQLHQRYPDDVDAAAFYGLSILGTAHGGRDFGTYMRAAGVLEEAWTNHREHPGLLHYLIHSYDDPIHAPLGLRAARIYARVAPDAGHAQHMTAHIFLALGMWPETVRANIAAIADVNKMRLATEQGPVACGHYPTWLEYAYLQLGKVDQAREVLEACHRAAEAQADTMRASQEIDPDESLAGSFANMRLRFLVDSGDWDGVVAAWPPTKNAGPAARLDFATARAFMEIARRNAATAAVALVDLDAAARSVADIEARSQDPDPTYSVRAQIVRLEIQGLLAELNKDLPGAEEALRQATALQDTLPIAFGPPVIDKPTHELLGEFLLRHGRRADARKEFEQAIARTPGRRLAVEGLNLTSTGTGQN